MLIAVIQWLMRALRHQLIDAARVGERRIANGEPVRTDLVFPRAAAGVGSGHPSILFRRRHLDLV